MHLHTSQQVAIFRDRTSDDADGWPCDMGEAEVVFFRLEDAPSQFVRWALVSGRAGPQPEHVDANTPIYSVTVRKQGHSPHGAAVVWRCSLHCHCRAVTPHGTANFVGWHWDETLGLTAALFTPGAHALHGAPHVV